MAPNEFDDEAFFDAYAGLARSRLGLDGAPEWRALRGLLPPVAGRRVVDLGCGFGWFCRWARAEDAAHVVGIDGSARMLDRARATTDDPAVDYVHADLDEIDLGQLDGPLDIVFSSLALHYVRDLDRLLHQAWRAIADGGALVCSVEHPIFTAPIRPGFVDAGDGAPTWPVDGYADEGERVVEWLGATVRKQHRTIETYLRSLRGAGFVLDELIEWAPTRDQVAARPDLATELTRPTFLLLGARRGEAA